ncbi:MAG: tRNA (N6-threonylcarbamoyladenosine(37)-N6)-methyltransferase TrmO [Clostridia bacterium]|nr:tRNA (N6-threonylcarbamoyladenosine(37)-N6)-methyltransferase TrmO [Clostridia bacterium]
MEIRPIAHLECDFPTKFGLPRQSGLNSDLTGRIVFNPEFRNPDAVRGLKEFSHIWLIWAFSVPEREGWQATVRPPRLGGNVRVGVFATRSPFRPNPLGLTVAKLLEVVTEGANAPYLVIAGADMMNGTEIFDIKPYIPYADAHPEATGSFAEEMRGYRLRAEVPEEMLKVFREPQQRALLSALELDPRPAYQNDPNRAYGFLFAGYDVRFTVRDGVLRVFEIVKAENKR